MQNSGEVIHLLGVTWKAHRSCLHMKWVLKDKRGQTWKMPHVQPVSLQKHWQAWAAGECSSPYNLTAASQTNFTGTREKEQRQKRIKWPLSGLSHFFLAWTFTRLFRYQSRQCVMGLIWKDKTKIICLEEKKIFQEIYPPLMPLTLWKCENTYRIIKESWSENVHSHE